MLKMTKNLAEPVKHNYQQLITTVAFIPYWNLDINYVFGKQA